MRPDLTEEERAQVLELRKWWEEHKHEFGTNPSPGLAERMRDQDLTNAYLREHPENVRLMEELKAMPDDEFLAYLDMPEDQRRAKFPWFFAARDANGSDDQ